MQKLDFLFNHGTLNTSLLYWTLVDVWLILGIWGQIKLVCVTKGFTKILIYMRSLLIINNSCDWVSLSVVPVKYENDAVVVVV